MDSKKSLITIITPTYNAEKYIEKCIESVRCQTYSNYKHIVIDGQSTDNTVGLVNRYLQELANLILINESDEGVYDAMNKGIKLSLSTWYYFLGADDLLYDKDVLKEIAEFIEKSMAQIIYGNVYFEELNRLYDGQFDIEKILKRNICHQSVFYHNLVFESFGIYDSLYRTEADYDLNLRCWLSGRVNHEYIPRTIAYYSQGGLSSFQIDRKFIEDYPVKTINAILSGNWKMIIKIHYLSKIYRKIIQRYPLKLLAYQVFSKNFFYYRILAILWMPFSSSFYLFKKGRAD